MLPSAAVTTAAAGGQACTAGLVLPAWSSRNSSSATDAALAAKEVGGQGVLVLYDFSSSRLTVVIGDGVGQGLMAAESAEEAGAGRTALEECIRAAGTASRLSDGLRVLGGQLRVRPGYPMKLRLLMDYSLLEIFTSDGQALSTRVYRGLWPAEDGQVEESVGPPVADSDLAPAAALLDAAAPSGKASSASTVITAVPCGCYLFADGGTVLARDIHMSAMGTAWFADMVP